jgi:hypothetical protein
MAHAVALSGGTASCVTSGNSTAKCTPELTLTESTLISTVPQGDPRHRHPLHHLVQTQTLPHIRAMISRSRISTTRPSPASSTRCSMASIMHSSSLTNTILKILPALAATSTLVPIKPPQARFHHPCIGFVPLNPSSVVRLHVAQRTLLDFVSIGSPRRHLASSNSGVEDPLK